MTLGLGKIIAHQFYQNWLKNYQEKWICLFGRTFDVLFRDTQQEGKFTSFQSKMNEISLVTTPKQVTTHDKRVQNTPIDDADK